MKTNVAQASLDAYFGGVKDKIAPTQKQVIRLSMCFGAIYTRAEIGRLCGYSQTSAGRAVNELIAEGVLQEVGRKVCGVNGTNVGAVTLSLSEAMGKQHPTKADSAASHQSSSDLCQGEHA